jgi:hypothetical protein
MGREALKVSDDRAEEPVGGFVGSHVFGGAAPQAVGSEHRVDGGLGGDAFSRQGQVSPRAHQDLLREAGAWRS